MYLVLEIIIKNEHHIEHIVSDQSVRIQCKVRPNKREKNCDQNARELFDKLLVYGLNYCKVQIGSLNGIRKYMKSVLTFLLGFINGVFSVFKITSAA